MGTANKRRKTPRKAEVTPPTPFARTLRDLREARGMSLVEVEHKVAQELNNDKDLAPSHERIRRMEVGLLAEDMIEADIIVALAEVYGVTAAHISPLQFQRAQAAHDLFARHVKRMRRQRRRDESNTDCVAGSNESPSDPHFMEKWNLGRAQPVPATS